jgi:hypothetical protein
VGILFYARWPWGDRSRAVRLAFLNTLVNTVHGTLHSLLSQGFGPWPRGTWLRQKPFDEGVSEFLRGLFFGGCVCGEYSRTECPILPPILLPSLCSLAFLRLKFLRSRKQGAHRSRLEYTCRLFYFARR